MTNISFWLSHFQLIDVCGVLQIISCWTSPSLTWWWPPSTPYSHSFTWEIGSTFYLYLSLRIWQLSTPSSPSYTWVFDAKDCFFFHNSQDSRHQTEIKGMHACGDGLILSSTINWEKTPLIQGSWWGKVKSDIQKHSNWHFP